MEKTTFIDDKKAVKALDRESQRMLDNFYGFTTMPDDTGTGSGKNSDRLKKDREASPAFQKTFAAYWSAYSFDAFASGYGFIGAKNFLKIRSIKNPPELSGDEMTSKNNAF